MRGAARRRLFRSKDACSRAASYWRKLSQSLQPGNAYRFALQSRGNVQIRIFNLRGELVNNLVDRSYEPGSSSTTWNGKHETGRNVASGIYMYKMRVGHEQLVRRLGLLR